MKWLRTIRSDPPVPDAPDARQPHERGLLKKYTKLQDMYGALSKKYEDLKAQRDDLIKKYEDLKAQRDDLIADLKRRHEGSLSDMGEEFRLIWERCKEQTTTTPERSYVLHTAG